MEDATATATETPTDWRQAWRAFAEQMSPKLEDTGDAVAQAVQETQDGAFRGFGSPQGKF